MAASTRAGTSTGLSMPKWQIALAIGAPVALGLGIWYYRSRKPVKEIVKEENIVNPPTNLVDNKPSETKIEEDKIAPSSVSSLESGPVSDTTSPLVSTTTTTTTTSNTKVEPDDPYKQSQVYKNRGNKHFKEGKYADAIKCYQQAIELCPKTKVQDVSTFHQNRAAAFEQLVRIGWLYII